MRYAFANVSYRQRGQPSRCPLFVLGGLPFVFRVDFDFHGVFIEAQVKDVGPAAHLTIFYIGLLIARTPIHKGEIGFAAIGAGIFCCSFHKRLMTKCWG